MKKHYWPVVALLLLGANPTMAQRQKDAYTFPIVPGTEQWKQLKTGAAMVESTQIPAAVLARMSTAGLAETCLKYPLLLNILAHDNVQSGFEAVTANFNGLQELLKRPDAGKALLQIYREMDPNLVDAQESEKKKGDYTFAFFYIEVLLAQPAILANLAPAERKVLVQEGFTKFKAKDAHLNTFSGFGEQSCALLMGRVLEKEGFSPVYQRGKQQDAMPIFLTTGQVTDPAVINRVVADAQAFLK